MTARKSIALKSKSRTRFVAWLKQSTVSPPVLEQIWNDQKYVYYGRNNLFPEYVRSLMDNCGPLERCATMLAQFIAGNGIKFYTRATDGKKAEIVQGAQDKFQELLQDTTEEQFLWQTAYDISHGLGMSWTVRRSGTADIVRLDHLDVVGYRSGLIADGKDKDGLPIKKPNMAFWSSDWAAHQANTTDETFKPVPMPLFEHGDEGKKFPISVLYDKVYKPRQPYYSVPWFLGAIRAAEVWRMVDEYNRTQLATGFTPAILMGTRFDGSEADQDRHTEKIRDAYQGATGEALFNFILGPGDEEPFFKELKRGNHAGELDQMRTGSADVVCDVYGVPTILFRDRSEGLTSQADSVGQRLQQFERTLVRPMQKLITRNLVKLLNIPEVWEAKIDPLEVFDPVQSEQVLLNSMTVDEARDQRGDDPLEDKEMGKKLLSQVKAPAPAGVDENGDPIKPLDPKKNGAVPKKIPVPA